MEFAIQTVESVDLPDPDMEGLVEQAVWNLNDVLRKCKERA
jgi:hypothetical protein